MPAAPSPDKDWSIAPTLTWFVAILGGALLYLHHDLDALRGLIDHEPAEGAETVSAGPTFVQKEAQRQQVASDDELEDEFGAAGDDDDDADDGDDERVRVADASTDTGGDADDVTPVRTAIEDACVDGTADSCKRWAMDGYYDAIDRGTLTRLSLWGDSVTAEGYIAGGMRSRLVKRHGDGGAGFVFMAKPSRWYQNTAVRQQQSGSWTVESIVHNAAEDGMHGYGGASFTGTAGDTVTFKTAKSGPGSKVSRFELYYLAGPKGGIADIVVDGETALTVDTTADVAGSGFAAVDLDDGAHTIVVKVLSGRLRAFGVTMERASGVLVDSLGIVSNTTKNMLDNKSAHWQEQLAHRDADLMMILLGTNESQWVSGKKALDDYKKAWNKLLARVRKGNPDGSCLVIGTLDAGSVVDGKFVGRKALDQMLAIERAAAQQQGCAFWDARGYMGGKDSARAWRKKGLMSGDFEHLTKKGGRVLGSGIVEALEAGYASRSR